ncbi:MAG TPA: hypothetical protein VK986_26120 [Tepidisphaeraceae bacterium]|nr:hypothetical protein [Tepidisphaeraceae bacterium]
MERDDGKVHETEVAGVGIGAARPVMAYASPVAMRVDRGADQLQIILGPMPTAAFVLALAPVAVFLVAGSALLAVTWMFLGATTSGGLFLATMLIVVAGALGVSYLGRHRLAAQQITVLGGEVYHSGPRTGGRLHLVIHDVAEVRVRRVAGVLPIWKLVVRPPAIAGLRLGFPVTVLAVARDRDLLLAIAKELREELGLGGEGAKS